VQVIYNNRKF